MYCGVDIYAAYSLVHSSVCIDEIRLQSGFLGGRYQANGQASPCFFFEKVWCPEMTAGRSMEVKRVRTHIKDLSLGDVQSNALSPDWRWNSILDRTNLSWDVGNDFFCRFISRTRGP